MVGTSSSSSSSISSFSSLDDVPVKTSNSVKFLCSYGGKILPRYPDGKLRYVGGDTRVLSVDRSVPFSELQAKMRELCGYQMMSIRCQLPNEDIDALVRITSNEDLQNLVEEYDFASRDRTVPIKIRAFMYQIIPSSNTNVKSKGKVPARPPPIPVNSHHVHHGNNWQ